MSPENSSDRFMGYRMAVAVIVVIAFGVFTTYMILKSDAAQSQWTRLTYVYTGIEAIVFAAAGLLFGTVIQSKRVEAAERGEHDASELAATNERAAEVSRVLKADLRVIASPASGGVARSTPGGARQPRVGGINTSNETDRTGLRQNAERLLALVEEIENNP